jgi:hypothetical protein
MKGNKDAWVVRANPHHISRIVEFRRDGLVALGWPNLGNLAAKNLAQIKDALRQADAYRLEDNRELGTSAGLLDTFVNRVHEGDYVVVPDPDRGAVYVGEFEGGYRYVKAKERAAYPHQRTVRWLFPRPRRELPATVISSLRAQQPIFGTDAIAMTELVRQVVASGDSSTGDDVDTDIHELEGDIEYVFSARAKRVRRLRDAKLRQATAARGGRLRCEVPGCGFDFEGVYGDLGKGFAHIHHLRLLRSRGGARETTLRDLAIVCANCHAMIHRRGGCRKLDELIVRVHTPLRLRNQSQLGR